jgi:hypothetical protein
MSIYYSGGKYMQQSFLDNDLLIVCCLCLAVFRIYLEVINFNFNKLPISKAMKLGNGKFHRYGLYFSIGYFVLFAPSYLLS